MADTTTNLGLPLLSVNQSQKEVTINDALNTIDVKLGGSGSGSVAARISTAINTHKAANGDHTADVISETTGRVFVTPTQKAAIGTAEQAANKGVAGGYCGLGSDGLVPSTNLPVTAKAIKNSSIQFDIVDGVLKASIDGGTTWKTVTLV